MISTYKQLAGLYQKAEHADYVGEPLSQSAHGLQAAALAKRSGDEALVLAALLHDVGHLCDSSAAMMDDVGILNHESIGADFLSGLGFSKRVCRLVEGHVNAKRYLVTTQDSYELSSASEKTLSFQGGKMSSTEVAAFESSRDFSDLLKLRAWDEAAKQADAEVPTFASYQSIIERHLEQNQLTKSDLEMFAAKGYLHVPGIFSKAHIQRMVEAVHDLETRPETPGKWMKYYESSERLLCRVENFIQYSEALNRLIAGPAMLRRVSQLMGVEACLFKEKINFKLPGGAGFLPHQDAPAFTTFGHDYHITAMLSFDSASDTNGCLQVAEGRWENKLLPTETDLTLRHDVIEQMDFKSIETQPGDLLFFGSYIPHRSGPNHSDVPRRALYATYNARAEGDVRDQYFAEKRKVLPPDVEREPGKDYSNSGVFNVGNPVQTEGLNT